MSLADIRQRSAGLSDTYPITASSVSRQRLAGGHRASAPQTETGGGHRASAPGDQWESDGELKRSFFSKVCVSLILIHAMTMSSNTQALGFT